MATGSLSTTWCRSSSTASLSRSASRPGPLPLREAVEIAREIARALSSAHANGIVHRDLKPDNLFLTREGHTKVLDFGLAKLTEVAPASASGASMSPTVAGTSLGQMLGTAGYMAPEQVRGEAVDARADIFAFGCVLHEMLTGQRAFAGRTVHQTLDIILNDEPQTPTAATTIPDRLDWIRRKCLDKDPSRRYQHADDLARFADALASGRTGDERSSSTAKESAVQKPGLRDVLTSVPGLALLAIAALAIALTVFGGLDGAGAPPPVPEPVRLTRFTTAVTGAAISPNGQMLAFMVAESQSPGDLNRSSRAEYRLTSAAPRLKLLVERSF